MRMEKKKVLQFTTMALCLACLTGCGKGTNLPNSSSIPANVQDIPSAGSEGHQQPDGSGTGSGTTGNSAELPEGYVYDYQVSLEPIPQEIADLGGMCVGTMHAFPSRIMVGLMKQRMEEDPELKAEVEKRVEEVKQSLSEEIGGEFEVEIMLVEDKWDWVFYCTEKETGYEFNMSYHNTEYKDPTWLGNRLFISDYYDKLEAKKHEEDLQKLISEIYEDSSTSIWYQVGIEEIDIYIAQFVDREINYKEQQILILGLWKLLQEYNSENYYRIYLSFYPVEYEELIRQKCGNGLFWDIHPYNREKIEELIQKKEIYDVFFYFELQDEDNFINMDTLLDDYISGAYDETAVWDYWVRGEN